jgi:HlyD family secretion protein
MNDNTVNSSADVADVLDLHSSIGRGRRWIRRFLWIVFLSLAAIGLAQWKSNGKTSAVHYKTDAATHGSLIVTVTATGNLKPTDQVEVGSELSGIVQSVEVDYNDQVKVGQVLAKLDTTKLKAQMQQTSAALAAAKAQLLSAQATVVETRNELSRLTELRKMASKAISQHDLDAGQAALDRAKANEAQAKAAVSQSKAALDAQGTDLSKTEIRSPVKGVVLKRSIDPGQTVAAAFQAPVLFLLAEDLAKMELHVDVDEADVGEVKTGQEATFVVDAYPDRKFPARIRRVNYGSETTAGVVTYKTVLDVDNSDLTLRPGMTATATVTVQKIEDAILIPNTALRFTPPEEKKADSPGGSILSKILPHPPRPPAKTKTETNGAKKQPVVWTVRDNQLVSIPVTLGSTDGTMTVVLEGDVVPGMELVVDTVKVAQ